MQYTSLLAIVLAAASVSAQDLDGLPSCAEAPALSALGTTGCGTNITCVCNNKSFLLSLEPQIEKSCTAPGQLACTCPHSSPSSFRISSSRALQDAMILRAGLYDLVLKEARRYYTIMSDLQSCLANFLCQPPSPSPTTSAHPSA